MKIQIVQLFVLSLLTLFLLNTCEFFYPPEVVEWEVEEVRYDTYSNDLWIYIANDEKVNQYTLYIEYEYNNKIRFNKDTYSEIIDIGTRNILAIDGGESSLCLDFVTPPLLAFYCSF
jgi:hypothetical protein